MKLILGDSLQKLKDLPTSTIDCVVTDPPAGISFMSRGWDSDKGGRDQWIAWLEEIMRECFRVLKPGAHAFVWGLPRTSHWTATAIENAGFEIRDVCVHLYGSGFPKSLSVSKAIDKAAGAEREVIGQQKLTGTARLKGVTGTHTTGADDSYQTAEMRDSVPITAPATDDARKWDGWGTALKPASEHWILARKPLEKGLTVAENVLKWGTGAMNIDGTRIAAADQAVLDAAVKRMTGNAAVGWKNTSSDGIKPNSAQGRWPANVLLSCCGLTPHDADCAAAALDEQSGTLKNRANKGPSETSKDDGAVLFGRGLKRQSGSEYNYAGEGGASRFFKVIAPDSRMIYCAKAGKKERSLGLDKHHVFKVESSECKDANTAAAQLLQKVTSGSTVKWLTDESGKSILALCQTECRSTTLTEINRITASKILNALIQSLTNESTPDASETAPTGPSLVESAASLKVWLLNTTSGETALALGASRVANSTLQSISENENSHALLNNHNTVKPVQLMRYLVRLVARPGAIVLDPFLGSGTTGVAAIKEGCEFIGIEQSEAYLEIARRRIEHAEQAPAQLELGRDA
jgi:hypothetical protein